MTSSTRKPNGVARYRRKTCARFCSATAAAALRAGEASERTQEILRQLVSSNDGSSQSPSDLVGLVMSQGGRAWAVGQQIAGTAARMVIGLVTLIAGTYAILVDGERWYVWIENHAPIPASALRRLAGAFIETDRGLLVGIGGAGLAQSIVAPIVYASIGVPQALALGLLTLVFSVVPAVGTAIVWIPVVAGLAVTGRSGAAVVLLIAGVAVIGKHAICGPRATPQEVRARTSAGSVGAQARR